jgi:CBS domain-containing protein
MGNDTVAEAMTSPVLTLDAATPIDEAARAMTEGAIKSLVVIDEDCRPAGIFTSTDAVRMAAEDRSASETTVEEYMTTDVRTTDPEASLAAVAGEMIEQGINHVPAVGEEGNVVGILTTTDLAERLSIETSERTTQVD